MDESVGKNDDQQELRLVDLLATIIRHRGWVIWTTALGTVAAGIVLFLLPLFGIAVAGAQTITLQAVVRVVTIPTEAQSLVNFDIGAIILAQRSNLRLVGQVYRDTLMTTHDSTLTTPAFNRLVRTFTDRSFRVVPDASSATVLLTLKVRESDQDKGTQFLKEFIADSRDDLGRFTKTQTEQAISSMEVSTKASSELAIQSQARYEVAAKALRGILANPDFPMVLVGGIDAVQDEPGVSRVIVLFLVLILTAFVGILLAFASDIVSQAGRDPATVDLLKKAWRGE